jgi:5'(3')-deoxyribonucleotidase
VTGRLCVDIDNCVAATDERMRDLIRTATDGRVNFTYEDIREFDYYGKECRDSKGETLDKATWDQVHDLFSDSESILGLNLLPGAHDALSSLGEIYELHFVTTRLPKARVATIQWLDQQDFGKHFLHFVGHRTKHTAVGAMAAAIEDDPIQARAFADAGTRSILLAHPWNANAGHDIERLASWTEISEVLQASL